MDEKEFKELVTFSAREVFQKMITLEITEEPSNGDTPFENKAHISAAIGFAGGWMGSITFQCELDLASLLTAKMLFMEEDNLEKEEIRDAMGEVINMIGGKFKATFAERFNNGQEAFKMSVPTVTTGQNFQIFSVKTDSVLGMLFNTKKYVFQIRLALKKTTS